MPKRREAFKKTDENTGDDLANKVVTTCNRCFCKALAGDACELGT